MARTAARGPKDVQMNLRLRSLVFLVLSILASLGGIAAFILLFRRDFNVYWIVVAPVILAFYQLPAAWFFKLHKKAARRLKGEADGEDEGENKPAGPSVPSVPPGPSGQD